MNGWDALKTGRRIRRTGATLWHDFSHVQVSRAHGADLWVRADLDADNWEIEPAEVKITAEEFWEAYREAQRKLHQCDADGVVAEMARRLGLG